LQKQKEAQRAEITVPECGPFFKPSIIPALQASNFFPAVTQAFGLGYYMPARWA
jgi:hypothetical protein